MSAVVFILGLQVLTLAAESQSTFYVKPDNVSSSCPSPESTCHTLDKYAKNQSQFFVSYSKFTFLPGNHTTHQVISLQGISDIVFNGQTGEAELYKIDWAVQCVNVSKLIVKGLSLTSSKVTQDTMLSLSSSYGIQIVDTVFDGSDNDQTRAISLNKSEATIENCTFRGNTAVQGGALTLLTSRVNISQCDFVKNSADRIGGAIFSAYSHLLVAKTQFINNCALEGGGIFASTSIVLVSSTQFFNNSADIHTPAAAVTIVQSQATFVNTTCTSNQWTAMQFYWSSVNFIGTTVFSQNIGNAGGGISAEVSNVSFSGYTRFEENYACTEGAAFAGIVHATFILNGITEFIDNGVYCESDGGGGAVVITVHSKLVMHGSVLFDGNNCTTCYGGGISAVGECEIVVFDNVTFTNNWAEMGGGIYIRFSTLALNQGSKVTLSGNTARYFGGGIFHMDNINYYQCDFTANRLSVYPQEEVLFNLPDCFIRLNNFTLDMNKKFPSYEILSYNDTAGTDGQFLYGGLMDKCRVLDLSNPIVRYELLSNVAFKYNILHIQTTNTSANAISSEAFTLCLCENNTKFNCTGKRSISVLRGERFNVSLLALSQMNTITAPYILARISKTARLKLNQNRVQLAPNCTTLSYNIYSTNSEESLILYPDKTCRDQGIATVTIDITFLPCPVGFAQSGDKCICEDRLQKYMYADLCTVYDNENFITRTAGSHFWVGYSNNSEYGTGLILYRSCPADYCTTKDVNISITNVDALCSYNHSGLLCASCAVNYSLTLGDSRCRKCSNIYLLLIIAFALAGILLIIFLSILRLTVATGMINSIILYANIVQANKIVFFSNTNNVLTVFIAWMNFDFGIPVCFYDGMDAYAQAWLQFAFPVYVWVLISLIIITSRYSTRMTKLIGTNPIAVLATLLLMSYTKLLKNVIEIYSSVHLEYPNTKITVWFKDATVPYLQSQHLLLAVLTSLFIAGFFIPYTVFLLFGYQLYRFSNKKLIRWFMIRMKPLLDSYYAPHEKHSRFWPGLLLLVRCGLYIAFTSDYIHGSNNSTLAISVVFTTLIVAGLLLSWFSIKIYKSFIVTAIEAVVFLDIIILSIANSNGIDTPDLTLSLVSIVFAIMICIVFYHFHLHYFAKTAVWTRLNACLFSLKGKLFSPTKVESESESERRQLIQHTSSATMSRHDSLLDLLDQN